MVLPVDSSIHKIEELKKENALLKQELAKVRARDRKVRKTTGERSNQNLFEKNSGESLQKNKELFAHIIEIANEGIWVCNTDAETMLINKKIAELLGYSPDEMMGKSAYYFMDDEAKEIAKSNFEKGKQGHTRYFQQKYIRKDGSFLWASVAAYPIHDEQGNMVATLGMITDITESKLNVNALHKSETQYRHLVESVNSIIIRWNVNGILTYFNEYALQFFGYRKKEMTGKDVMMLVPKTDSSGRDLTSLANDVLENPGKYVQFENENILKNGERVWISWTNRAIVDENGKLLEVLAVGNDITKRKKAEYDLKRSEEFFSTLFELLPVGVSLATFPNGAVHNVNQAWLDLTGYSRKEEVFGKTSLELGLMRDPKQRESLLNEFREKSFVKNAETTFFTKAGEQRVVSINIYAIQIKEQKFLLSTNTDITERKKTEERLQKSEERFHALADNISQMAWIVDQHGKALWLNKRWYEYTGVSIEDVLTGLGSRVQHPDHSERVRNKFLQSIKSGQSWEDIYPLKGKDGNYRWFLSHALPIQDEGGNIIYWFGTHTDITEQRNVEEALQQQNIELIRAKEKAEENDRFKTAFIANISHEIRTPMSGILGFADLLKVPYLSSESQATYIEAIIVSSNRMLNIINDLLNISKIEGGQIEIRKEVTDINKLIDELFIFFLPEANKKGIVLKINKELPVNKISVETDKTKLSQVITNLMKNALKYTREGFIEFGCRMKDDSLLFYVEDTGLGIKKEHQEMIFERFKQGEVSNSGIPEGVGLGLAISKAYVEELGGTIWVKSAPTKGSVFYFTIPFKEPNVNVPSKKKEEKTVKTSLTNILIAEDEDFIFLYLNEVLRLNNMNAIHARNGEEAVNVIKNNPNIDLIIMDGRMPVMGGPEATRKIKKIRPDIPIIALSAMAHDTDIQDALEAGCVAYLTKPIDKKVLLNTISSYVVSKT